MLSSIYNVVLTTYGKVQYDIPLNQPLENSMNEGWSMVGDYFTTTDEEGQHTLEIEGWL